MIGSFLGVDMSDSRVVLDDVKVRELGDFEVPGE